MTPRIDHGDFENELRDLFREKAGEAPLATPSLPASAPRQVLRRGRIHQLGTVLGSAIVVVALIVGSVAGLTRILGEGEKDRVGSDDYEVFPRTATIEAFIVGSPSDWYLVNEWPLSMLIAVEGSGGSSSACGAVPGDGVEECIDTVEETSSPIPVPSGLPMLQLSNVDLGLGTNACEGELPADAAVLYVAYDQDVAANPRAAPSPDPFPPGERGLPPVGSGPCGPGRYAHFTVNGEPFFTWIGVGARVTADDREIVETSYEMMSAIPDWELSPPAETTPAYVIDGGLTQAGTDWRLELRPSQQNVALSLVGVARSSDFVIPPSVIEWAATDPIFGAISKQAAAVEFRGKDDPSIAIPGTIVPLPPSMPFDFDLFFIEGTAGIEGEPVALGPDGEPIEGPSSVGTVRDDVVRLEGSTLGHDWMARFLGAFEDDTACIDVTIDDEGSEPLCPSPIATSLAGAQPSLHVVNTADLAVVVGSVPPEVVEIRFTSDSGSTTPSRFPCQMGPVGWTDPDRSVCALALPPQDGGTFEYLGSDGDVLFEEGMAWFSAQGEPVAPTPVDPVHGGTYWAVYPWLGAAGSPDAENVSALLLEDFGIEAFPGDLSCDDGAAEALGTDAPQGIGVYFETEDEANAFADQAGLLGHEADPVIARVTTYCLD
ncbi:MAG TPA: hypothetical protein VF195_09665 [Actinomycetota bacterium]